MPFLRATLPESGCSRPLRIRNRVDLPHPLGPTMPRRESLSEALELTAKETFWKRGRTPNDFDNPETVSQVSVIKENLHSAPVRIALRGA